MPLNIDFNHFIDNILSMLSYLIVHNFNVNKVFHIP